MQEKAIHYWTHEKLAQYLGENGFQQIKTVTQTEHIAPIAEQFGNKAQAQAAFKSIIHSIAAILKAGDSLSIIKGFGTFKVTERAAWRGRNPATGQEIEIPASKTMKFMPFINAENRAQ